MCLRKRLRTRDVMTRHADDFDAGNSCCTRMHRGRPTVAQKNHARFSQGFSRRCIKLNPLPIPTTTFPPHETQIGKESEAVIAPSLTLNRRGVEFRQVRHTGGD